MVLKTHLIDHTQDAGFGSTLEFTPYRQGLDVFMESTEYTKPNRVNYIHIALGEQEVQELVDYLTFYLKNGHNDGNVLKGE